MANASGTTSADSFENVEPISLNNPDNNEDVVYHYQRDGREYWIPKCDEQLKPYIKQFFHTIDDAYEFYKEYGRHCGFDVRKFAQKKYKDGSIKCKWIVCSNAGSNDSASICNSEVVDERHTKRRRTASSRCYCDAKMILKFIPGGFVVNKFIEEHKHPLISGSGKQFLRCNRNLSSNHMSFILDLRKVNIGPMRAYNAYKEMVGSYENVGATATDFLNFSRDVKARIGEHDADMILEKFRLKRETSNNSFFYEYKVDSKGHLTGLFWCDAIGRKNYSVFGDIVSFDPTFRTNKYHMVFVPFTGVDNHWNNVTFASALLEKEDHTNFEWVLDCVQKAMDHIPPCVITDQCPAIKKALENKWPDVKHRLCMWHIMNKLSGKVPPSLASDKAFMDRLKSVVWADHLSVEEFEDGWKSVIDAYELNDNVWLTDMYTIRDEWIPAYFNDVEMAGLLRTTSRSESSNFYFQHYQQSGDTLIEFYSRYESAIDNQRHGHAKDNKASEIMPQRYTTTLIEKDAAEQYTRQLYCFVSEEIKSAFYHTSIHEMQEIDGVKHLKVKDFLMNNRIFEVTVSLNDYHVHCSCKLFVRRGYLCKHAFVGLHQCEATTIPRGFIKTRWTKNAVKKHAALFPDDISDHCTQLECMKVKKHEIWFDFQACMSYVGQNMEKANTVHTGVKALKSAVKHQVASKGVHLSAENIDAFIDSQPPKDVSIQNPNFSRNKGCGSRIKGGKEVSMNGGKRRRKCSICSEVTGHNARSCPLAKK